MGIKMNKFLSTVNNSIHSFAKDEEGAQVVEYALIIAVVSIALVIALKGLTDTTGGFTSFITRISACLTGSATCA
jgi:pilus assembly protein Flp/PilA